MMTAVDVAHARLRAQRLEPPMAAAPSDLVRWMGAVQAQDLPLSRWSIGQRTACDAPALDAAIADGSILRTHVLRPTWHFVAREDIVWMLALTSKRIRARLRYYDRQHRVDDDTIQTSGRAIQAAIRKSGHLTKARVAGLLRRRGIRVDSAWDVTSLLMHAELSGIICSGIPQGAEQTFALMEERAPRGATLAGDEALAELATRYFQSHSPATVQDFGWWSGLGTAEAKRAVQMIGSSLDDCEVAGGARVLVHRNAVKSSRTVPRGRAHLLQAFDELVVAYNATRAMVDQHALLANAKPEGLLTRSVVLEGQMCGRWRKEPRADGVTIRVELLTEVGQRGRLAIERAVRKYGTFLGQPASSTFVVDDDRRGRPGHLTTAAGK